LQDLAKALTLAGHDAVCLGVAENYGNARGVRRLLRDLSAHVRLAAAVLGSGPCDWIIAFSDPMGLPFTARVLALLKRARLAHWAMDVYPQTAVALGAVREGWLTRLIAAAMRWGYRGCTLLVALDGDMRAELARASSRPVEVLPPWPPQISTLDGIQARPREPRRWLYSGNLGRAHEFETLLQAQQLLEQRGASWELCFQGGGPARAEAEALARKLELKHCRWESYVSEEDLVPSLLKAHALIATQRPATRGLLWPSKLALMKHMRLPIVWVGPVDGAVADQLRSAPLTAGVFSPGQAAALADWLAGLPPSSTSPADLQDLERQVALEREAGGQWWIQRLGSCCS
jgi:glycosyltransferase involved in cell wall biosynthesis